MAIDNNIRFARKTDIFRTPNPSLGLCPLCHRMMSCAPFHHCIVRHHYSVIYLRCPGQGAMSPSLVLLCAKHHPWLQSLQHPHNTSIHNIADTAQHSKILLTSLIMLLLSSPHLQQLRSKFPALPPHHRPILLHQKTSSPPVINTLSSHICLSKHHHFPPCVSLFNTVLLSFGPL